MNINNSYKQTFTSRNATIRFADDIVRKVNREFPRISSTKVESLKKSANFKSLLDKLWINTHYMRHCFGKNFIKAEDSLKKMEQIFDSIKNNCLGNCRESAQITLIASRMNGIENAKIAHLTSPEGYDYDHAVVFVEDKKPYIIDAWLGFADYVPNAIKRYQKEFRNCFDFEKAQTENMQVKEDFGLVQYFLNNEVNEKVVERLKNSYKNLVLKNNR